jgi:ABC-type sugar transport system substrate-binding protein
VKGLKETLGSKVGVVGEPATDCDQIKGLNAALDLLTAHPGLTAIYGACGPPIIGAPQAVKAAGTKPGHHRGWFRRVTRRWVGPTGPGGRYNVGSFG